MCQQLKLHYLQAYIHTWYELIKKTGYLYASKYFVLLFKTRSLTHFNFVFSSYSKETKIMINHNSVISPLTFYNGFTINDLLQNLPSEWIIYDTMIQNGHLSLINNCTLVSAVSVAIFCGQMRLQQKFLKDLDILNTIGKH